MTLKLPLVTTRMPVAPVLASAGATKEKVPEAPVAVNVLMDMVPLPPG